MDELPSSNNLSSGQEPNTPSQHENAADNSTLPVPEEFNITDRGFMHHIGATPLAGFLSHPPFDWIRGKIKEYRSSQETQRLLQEVLPVDIRKIGMEGVVQLPSSNGKYIVHIGQIHSTSDAAVDSFIPDIETSQRTIEKFLTGGQVHEVFLEGQVSDTQEEDAILENIRNIPLTRDFILNVNMFVSQIAKHIGDRKLGRYRYVLRKKIDDYSEKCKQEGWKAERDMLGNVLDTLSIADKISNPYVEIGATGILRAQGSLKTYPAEEKDSAYSHAIQLLQEVNTLRSQLIEKTFDPARDNNELQEMKERLNKLQHELIIYDHSEREAGTIRTVTQHPDFKDNKVTYLIYGASHNFSQALQDHNAQDPDNARGLIYITDKETFSNKDDA